MTKKKTIPIFVPHMGCPNDCSFCNQRKITGQKTHVTPEIADRMIQVALSTISADASVEIGFFGGSFTGIEKALQRQFLEVAHRYIEHGQVTSIRLSTRPDYIDKSIVAMLKEYGVSTVELGAQSMDDNVLLRNRRGHTSEDIRRASEMILSGGLNLGLQMMTGLYGDTNEICIESAKKIIGMHPSCVRIYPTLVLQGTYLAELYQKGEYQPQTLDEAVMLCADLKELFDEKSISVIRMGLMVTDNINPSCDVVAGPYHPSFGELVQSEILFRKIKTAVNKDSTIYVYPQWISTFIGNKKRNIVKMKQLGFDIKFVQNESVLPGEFILEEKKGGKECV